MSPVYVGPGGPQNIWVCGRDRGAAYNCSFDRPGSSSREYWRAACGPASRGLGGAPSRLENRGAAAAGEATPLEEEGRTGHLDLPAFFFFIRRLKKQQHLVSDSWNNDNINNNNNDKHNNYNNNNDNNNNTLAVAENNFSSASHIMPKKGFCKKKNTTLGKSYKNSAACSVGLPVLHFLTGILRNRH